MKIISGLFLLVTIFLSQSIFAQSNASNYSQNKVDQTKRSSARIDPVTLGLNLDIPLGVYSGRGGASVPLSISYSSKVWTTFTLPGNEITQMPDQDVARFAAKSVKGWTSSFKIPIVDFTGKRQPYSQTGYICDGCQMAYVARIQVDLPDGSSHELRRDDIPMFVGSTIDWTGVYYAVDGSQMRYETESKTLFLADGSRYIINGAPAANDPNGYGLPSDQNGNDPTQPVEYIDRNGNKLVYSPTTQQWSDGLGRNFSNPLSTNPSTETDTTYSIPGPNGTSITYTFRWRTLQNSFSNPATQLHYPGDQRRSIVPNQNYWNPHLFPGTVTISQYGGLLFNPVVLKEVQLPNGQKYQFGYNQYGEIDKVTYPTGSYEKFTYSSILPIDRQVLYSVNGVNLNRGVTQQKVSAKGDGTDEAVWTYSANYNANYTIYTVTTNNPDGTVAERLLHPNLDPPTVQFGFDSSIAGKVYEDRLKKNGVVLRRTLTEWATSGPTVGGWATANRNPRVNRVTSLIFEGISQALAKSSTYQYDQYQNVIATNEFHYAVVDSGTAQTAIIGQLPLGNLARISETDYVTDGAYIARQMVGLPKNSRVKDSAGNIVSQSQLEYDEAAYPILNFGGATNWQDPATNARANVTTTKVWDNSTNLWLASHAQYDNFGNLRKAWDALGNMAETEYSATYQFAYPTKIKSAVPNPSGQTGSNAPFETNTIYDYATGLTLSVTDANGQTASIEYNDPLLRPTRVVPPSGGSIVETYYNDTPGSLAVKVRKQIDGVNWDESESYLDGLGRTIKSRSKDSQGDVFVETEYDIIGRLKRSSNPYRIGETIGWKENFYDDLNRIIKIKTADNAEVLTSYGLSTGSLLGTFVVVTDQAGKQKRSVSNGLGQLVRVDEPNEAGSLGTVDSPTQPTFYAYNTLNALVQVTQGAQARTFVYDSLNRLRQATNPESGTSSFNYDNNGNLINKTDARGITTTLTYDNLNRVVSRSYSDGTPTVSNFYDGTGLQQFPNFAKGKLTKVASAVSTTEYLSFDNLGRLLAHRQTTDGTAYNTGYTYNLAGALIEETYPSGRKVRNSYQSDGDLGMVETQKAGGAWQMRASNFSYTSAGAVNAMQLGNGKWETALFNNRLQVTQIGLGSNPNSTDLWQVNFDYGTTDNNGNVKAQQITVPGQFTAVQTYTYDSLNRLKSSTETIGGSQTWKQTFIFDRFGNRKFDAAQTTTLGGCPPAVCNPDINTANNRVTTHQFDNSGNTTQDAEGKTFFYDAENMQKEARNSQNQIIGQYFFDGNGKRVKKISNTETTIFVYDAGGQLIAEYSNQTSQTPQVSYLTSDTLGSPRVLTNASGAVTSRHDYMAYGEEISRPNYGSDSVRQKYTGYEKDSETDLDFAQARMYVSKLGRFSTVDPLMASASAINPQTFNRYSYVINSPYKLIDPSGLAPEGKSGSRATPMEDWGFGLWGNDDAEARYEKDLARTREDIKDAKDAQTALDSGDWDTFFTIMGRNKDLAEANAALIENLLTRQTQDPLEELFALVNEIFGNGAVVPLPSEDNLKRWVQITQENKNMVGLLKLGVFLFYRSGLLNDDEKNNPLSGLDEKGMKNYIFKLASVFSQYVLSNVESMQLGYYQAREFDIVNNKPKDGTEQHLRYKQDFLVNRFTYIFERSWQRGLLENKKSKEPKTPN